MSDAVLRALPLALCAGLAVLPAVAQDSARERFHLAELYADQSWVDASQEAVEVYLRAITTGGAPVVGITPETLEISEDGRLVGSEDVEVETFGTAQRGVAWVLVLDTSPTMFDEVASMKQAVRSFVERADDWDEIAILTMAADVAVAAPFKADRAEVLQAIDALEASQTPAPTRRLDAVYAAIDLIRAADSQRRGVVLVFSDGSSDDSAQSVETVAAHAAGAAEAGRVMVYTVGYDTGFGDAGIADMRRLASATTGKHWQARGGARIEDELYGEIWAHVGGSYVVRFRTDLDGELHEVRVSIGDKEATRSVRYPDVGGAVPGWAFAVLAGVAVAVGVGAGLRARRTGRLVYKSGPEHGRTVRLRRGVNRIGQAADNEIVIPQETVSRRHAEIEVTGSAATLRDLDSTNGTYVNDVPVEGACSLSAGDRIRIADVDLEYVR
jgi:hypothetical protein